MKKQIYNNTKKYSVWAEVNLNNLEYNYLQIKKLVNEKFIIPIVKANAYGHGIIEISKFLENKFKPFYLGVARVDEGIFLRKNRIKTPIIVLGGILKEEIYEVIKYNLEPAIFSFDIIEFLYNELKKQNKIINIHLKINTGMNRLGIKHEEFVNFLEKYEKYKDFIKIKTVYTHFANADILNDKFTQIQLKRFIKLKEYIKGVFFHCANSAAIVRYKETFLDGVRPGIMLYGSFADKKLKKYIELKPVMTLKSRVIHILEVKKGDIVSYGGIYKVKKRERLGVVSIGYGDGLRRDLSNKWYVLIKGNKYNIVGRICMDLIILKIDKKVKIGDEVLIFGKDRYGKIDVEDMAKKINTISYEIFTGITERVKRIYIKDKN